MRVSRQGCINVFEALVRRNRAWRKQKTNKQLKKKKMMLEVEAVDSDRDTTRMPAAPPEV